MFRALQPYLRFARLTHVWMFSCGAYRALSEYTDFLADHSETLEFLDLYNSLEGGAPSPPRAMTQLRSLRLNNNNNEGGDVDEAESALVANCLYLATLAVASANRKHTHLHMAVAEHCPKLQQLYAQMGDATTVSSDLESLAVVLRRCKDLHTLEIGRLINNVTTDQVAAFAKSCDRVTRFRGAAMREREMTLLLSGLCSVQELALSNVVWSSATPLSAVTQLCGQLTSFTLIQSSGVIPPTEVFALCRALTIVETLCLDLPLRGRYWLTDELLSIIGAHCRCLRRLSIASFTADAKVVYTMGGVTALLQGCPALREVHLWGSVGFTDQMRALRPDVTFRAEQFHYHASLA
jgi:hypothetical protein